MELGHLIIEVDKHTIKTVLEYINKLAIPRISLFAVDQTGKLCGSVNEGDIRRAMLAGKGFDTPVAGCMNANCKTLVIGNDNYAVFNACKNQGIRFIPLIDTERKILQVIDANAFINYLPFEVVLMAGGKGERLMPLTEKTPKPLLKVGDKAIIDYNIERLIKFGVTRFHITLGYLGKMIEEHIMQKFGDVIDAKFYYENAPRGTAGSLSEIKVNANAPLLFMNCDLLTNIDYGAMYSKFISEQADLVVASIEYHIDLPYAVFEFDNQDSIKNLSEKPRYTYQANAGIYLLHAGTLSCVPTQGRYDATDFLEDLMKNGKTVKSFPVTGYWLDIGRHDDFEKAQRDVAYIKFDE